MISIDDYLEQARSRLDRVGVEDLDDEIEKGAIVVDIRPAADRERYGLMPGAIIIDRNVLEWRLAPSSEARTLDLEDGQRVILFCNDSYASSLAAVTLLELGVEGATDLAGGYNAYRTLTER